MKNCLQSAKHIEHRTYANFNAFYSFFVYYCLHLFAMETIKNVERASEREKSQRLYNFSKHGLHGDVYERT